MGIEYVTRRADAFITGKHIGKSEHNVNVCNLKELVPYRVVVTPGDAALDVALTFHEEMWGMLFSDAMKASLAEGIEAQVREELHAREKAAAGPDIDVEWLLGLGDDDEDGAGVEPAAEPPESESPCSLHARVTVATVRDWEYPNTYYTEAYAAREGDYWRCYVYDAVYHWYLAHFGYTQWCSNLTLGDIGIRGAALEGVPLEEMCADLTVGDTRMLLELSRARVITGSRLKEAAVDELSDGLKARVAAALARFPQGLFAKLDAKSAKNDAKLTPFTSLYEVVDVLTASKDVLAWIEGSRVERLPLVLLPWNPKIDNARNEYRVFVKHARPTAISQQSWYSITADPLDPVRVAAAVERLCARLFPRLPFPSATLDVWIDTEDFTAYLIECNPWGAFFSSGSSLFDWRTHFDAMHTSDVVTFALLE